MKNSSNSRRACRIGKAIVYTIIVATIAMMIAMGIICENIWSFANKDIAFVASEAIIVFVGYEVLMGFVRWADKKGIL